MANRTLRKLEAVRKVLNETLDSYVSVILSQEELETILKALRDKKEK